MRPDGAYDRARLNMAGEALLIVEFGAKLTPAISDAVLAFDEYLQDTSTEGLCESAPTGNSVALRFDPLTIAPDKFRAIIIELVEKTDWFSAPRSIEPKCWRLPVCYGGETGPDLEPLAARFDMPIDEVIKAHRSIRQRVFMIGFAPGFLYTGALPELFDVPRAPTIKPVVPAGSVSVAIGQSVISSTPHSTGWHTIGRTPVSNFDAEREPPFVISAGDEIEFYEIDQFEFERVQDDANQGLCSLASKRG